MLAAERAREHGDLDSPLLVTLGILLIALLRILEALVRLLRIRTTLLHIVETLVARAYRVLVGL